MEYAIDSILTRRSRMRRISTTRRGESVQGPGSGHARRTEMERSLGGDVGTVDKLNLSYLDQRREALTRLVQQLDGDLALKGHCKM